ncbi:hypothetical protein IW138_001488, partial [Coemansia sp. RSA 986]
GMVNEIPVHVLVDSGSQITIAYEELSTADILLDSSWLKEYKSVIHCEEDVVSIAEEHKRWKISGTVVLAASAAENAVKPITVNAMTKLMKNDDVASMGWICVRFPKDGLKSQLSIAALVTSQEARLATLCSKYKQILEQPPVSQPAPGSPEMEIHLTERSESIARAPYRLSHAEIAGMEK